MLRRKNAKPNRSEKAVLEAAYRPVRKALERVEDRLLAPDSIEELASLMGAASVGGRTPNPLEVKNYIVASGGKRIRAAITLLSAQLCGIKAEKAVTLAAAIELFHAASLVIDDMLADAETRRSRMTAHRRWNESTALEAAAGLQLRAAPTFLEAVKNAMEPVDLISLAGRSAMRVPWGAIRQHGQKMDLELTEDEYIDTIGHKTAALFELAAGGGAIIAGAPLKARNALTNYGARIGAAFQIRDDALDVIGSADKLGKPPGSDFREGKVTLPLIHFMGAATHSEMKKMTALMWTIKGNSWEEAALLMKEKGSIEYTTARGKKEAARAVRALSAFEDCDAKRSLEAIAFIASERKA